MNTITSISFDRFFYCPKREQFLRDTHKTLFDFKFTAEGKALSTADEAKRKAKSIKAIELANRIFEARKAAIKASHEMKVANGLTAQFIGTN